jgi:IS30 family transposase
MPRRYHHMTLSSRSQIYALKATGLSLRKIALQLKISPSTVCRELSRNRGNNGYHPEEADNKYRKRLRHAAHQAKKLSGELLKKVIQGLHLQWSPEQIAGRLRREGYTISHESIYRLVWADKKEGGSLATHLRHAGKKYHKRSSSHAGRGLIPGRVDISKRPQIVEQKSRIGDWEGDTIIGAAHKGAIATYVDRHSKYTALCWLSSGRKAQSVAQATIQKMKRFKGKVKTLTYDNGKEFSAHRDISKALKIACYFATPYHSWERGLNEHTNGLIRQYLPKSTDLSLVSPKDLQRIEDLLNHRPRKVLNYRTPFEVFFADLAPSGVALAC